MLAQQQPTRLPMVRREISEEERIQLEEDIRRERQNMFARSAIAQFETLSPVEILQRSIDQRRAELSLENRIENMSASSDESQNSNPSVITSYPRTLPESPFSVEEPESQPEGETIGTITVTPVPVTYSDVEYTNTSEHPNRTVTITECTESVSTENDNDTSARTPGQTFPPDDTTSR